MQRMKAVILIALVWCFVSAINDATAQTSPAFTLELSSSSPKVQNSGDVVVTIKMTNVSDHVIEYAVGGPWPLFSLQVQCEHGNIVKETAHGMKIHGTDPHRSRFFGSIIAAPLKIGETLTDKRELGKEYDLSVPGVYRVSASRIDPETHNVVKSNEIQITVLPK